MTGSEVAVQDGSALPALRHTGADTLEVQDIALPRLYIGQAISEAVQSGLVSAGDLFIANDADDPDPTVIAEAGSKNGVIVHPLALRKGLSRSIDGHLETWAYNDPSAPPANKQTGVWVTYTYALAIPSFDTDLPVRWVTSRTGIPSARKINTLVYRLEDGVPPYTLAFRLTTAQRQNEKGRYYIPQASAVTPDDEDLAVAEKLATLLGDGFAGESKPVTTQTDEPSI